MREIIGNKKKTDFTKHISEADTIDVDGSTASIYVHDGLIPGGRRVTPGLPRLVTAAGPVTVLPIDGTVYIQKTIGGVTNVTMEVSPIAGVQHVIKDVKGDASTNNIIIQSASGSIDNNPQYIINTNYGFVRLEYNGLQWSVI